MNKLKELVARCKCSVQITVNDHRGIYQNAGDALSELRDGPNPPEIDADVKARMLYTNTIVHLQFYPNTPIGSYSVWHYDVDAAIEAALAHLGPAAAVAVVADRTRRVEGLLRKVLESGDWSGSHLMFDTRSGIDGVTLEAEIKAALAEEVK